MEDKSKNDSNDSSIVADKVRSPYKKKIRRPTRRVHDGDFLAIDELSKYLHLSKMSIYRLIKTDPSFPNGFPIITGGKRSKRLWKKTDVSKWITSQINTSGSES